MSLEISIEAEKSAKSEDALSAQSSELVRHLEHLEIRDQIPQTPVLGVFQILIFDSIFLGCTFLKVTIKRYGKSLQCVAINGKGKKGGKKTREKANITLL